MSISGLRKLAKLGAFVLLGVFVVLTVALGSFLYIRDQNVEEVKAFNQELRDGLVFSCEHNGNPLRRAVQHMLEEDIQNTRRIDLREFFPGVDEETLRILVEEQNDRRRDIIKEIRPIDCTALYPSSE